MSQNEQHFGDDRDGFSHGLDEEGAMTGEVKPEEEAVDEVEDDATDEVAEEDKQVNDPDVDTRPAEPVPHTSNVVGRRNPDLPTEAPRGTVPAPGTAAGTSANGTT